MQQVKRIAAAMAAVLVFAHTGAALAAKGDEPTLILSSEDGRFEIYSNADPQPRLTQRYLKLVSETWGWLIESQQWSDTAPLERQPVQVRLLADPNALSGGTGRGFSMAIDRLHSKPELTLGTFAHELTHVQDRREAGHGTIPGFITEGRALLNGFAYRKAHGQSFLDYDRGLAHSIASYTPQQMKEVVYRMKRGDVHDPDDAQANSRLEFGGAWFLEYLRTTFNGSGYVDVQVRLARVITEVRRGQSFEAAFAQVFGVEFSLVQSSFVDFVGQHHGAGRVKNMIWEGLIRKG